MDQYIEIITCTDIKCYHPSFNILYSVLKEREGSTVFYGAIWNKMFHSGDQNWDSEFKMQKISQIENVTGTLKF